ncbi:hypothetical protein BCC1697_002436 [Burkholderia gladioli]
MRVELEVESDAITPLAVLRLLESEPISLDTGTKAVDKLLRSHDILALSVSSPLDNVVSSGGTTRALRPESSIGWFPFKLGPESSIGWFPFKLEPESSIGWPPFKLGPESSIGWLPFKPEPESSIGWPPVKLGPESSIGWPPFKLGPESGIGWPPSNSSAYLRTMRLVLQLPASIGLPAVGEVSAHTCSVSSDSEAPRACSTPNNMKPATAAPRTPRWRGEASHPCIPCPAPRRPALSACLRHTKDPGACRQVPNSSFMSSPRHLVWKYRRRRGCQGTPSSVPCLARTFRVDADIEAMSDRDCHRS